MKVHTRKQAIDAKCKDCSYDPLDVGTWKDQVESCTDVRCPLYSFRPVCQATINKRKEAKKAAMSPEELAKYKLKQDAARERFAQAK